MAITISAVIPAYNSADYIADSVKSIQNQSHPIEEIIIVDDGSTDETQSVVEKLEGDFVFFRQHNQGPSVARNAGIKAAKSDWIAFLDADDQWTPDKIACQLDVLKNHPSLALIASDMAEIDNHSRILVGSVLEKHHLLNQFIRLEAGPIPDAVSSLLQKNFIPTGTVLVKREAIIRVGLFNQNIRYGEDLELWCRIADKYPISCIPKVLMLRRQHGNNATQATTEMLEDLVKVMVTIRKWGSLKLRQQGLNPDYLVASAWNDLGYYHFANSNLRQSREAFLNSLREQMTPRGIAYFALSFIPRKIILNWRNLKQRQSKI